MTEFLELREQLDRIEKNTLLNKNVFTLEEAARFTGMSKSFLYKLTSASKIPHFKPFGKLIYLERAELESWLLQNPIKTSQQIEREAISHVTLNRGKK